ncbi:protein of unknown function [Shinella sp. WSC3-e]|nr:hypothetical protein SHINE37_42427 [Rhizobiaceae bacterium]CAK7257013.1 protein of unknown function [Shinella sp. WSC3-e]
MLQSIHCFVIAVSLISQRISVAGVGLFSLIIMGLMTLLTLPRNRWGIGWWPSVFTRHSGRCFIP